MLTKPVTYAKWIAATDVEKTFGKGNKARSGALLAVDNALLDYENAGPAQKLDRLHRLFDAYEDWAEDKGASGPDDRLKSIRNSGNQLGVFESWLKEEQARVLPQVEPGWLHGPNCYAYAMKCKRPDGNGMTPGVCVGRAASMEGLDKDQVAFARRLLAGIAADAAADGGKAITFHPDGVETATRFPDPADMPRDIPGGHYLVAMLATAGGFHFMRRDSLTGLWSHKNRSDGEAETSVQLIRAGRRLGRRSVPITDTVALELLRNLSPGLTVEPFGGGYRFAAYMFVPDAGITVEGFGPAYDERKKKLKGK